MVGLKVFRHFLDVISMCVLIALFFFVSAICLANGTSDPLSKEEREWLSKHNGKIRLAHDPNARPIDYLDENGEFKGLAADYVRLIEKRLNFKFDILKIKTWDEVVSRAKNREVDVLCTFTKNKDREKWMLFTEPYIIIKTVILTRNDFRGNLSLDNMKDKVVTFTKGWVIDDYLAKDYSKINKLPAVDADAAMNNLLTEKADVWITALTVASIKIEEQRVTNLRIAGETDLSFRLAFASRKDWPVLNSILKKGLAQISEKERNDIFNRWIYIRQQSVFQSKIFWIIVFSITGVSLLLILTVFFWNKTLKRIVDEKTEELEKERSLFRTIVDRLPIMITRYDPNANLLFLNSEFERKTGWNTKEIQDIDIMEKVYPDPEIRQKVFEYMQKASTEWREFSITSKTGQIIESEWSNIRLDDGTQVGIGIDISERKKAEEALRISHKRFLTVLDSIDATIYVSDMDTYEILFMNNFMINSFGRDLIGEKCWQAFRGETRPCSVCTNDKLVDENGNPKDVFIWQDQNPITGRWYINHDRAIEWTDGRLVRLQIATDITELKEMEKKYQQAQKMESIGQLAGGIAHDFNNILFPIMGFAQLSQDALPDDHPVQDNLSDILIGAKRASDLVKRILLFSRQKENKLKPATMQPIIRESYKLLRASIPANIEMMLDLYDGNDFVLCNDSELHEIILNLCTNAYHAIVEDYGKIILGLKKQTPPSKLNLAPGEYLCLSVKDTGVGIPAKIKNKIFEPYTTTKDIGKGSGLGLAVVYGIVQNHKGGIHVESDTENGTVFSIFFPITDQLETPKTEHDKKGEVYRGNEHILFVDDEESIVKLNVRVLEKAGYTVTAKTDSQEAFGFFKSHPDIIDLVITDMSMPGMVGSELSRKILEIKPDIPIIICSGYNEKLDQIESNDLKELTYLDKPLSVENLLKVVRQILDSSRQ